MELSRCADSVRFRFLQPESRLPRPVRLLLEQKFPFVQSLIDALNTSVPFLSAATRKKIRKLRGIPKMSTLAVGAIINECVRQMPEGSCYLNIGVWHGYSFFAAMPGNETKCCIGVDSFVDFGCPRDAFLQRFKTMEGDRRFYDMDWRRYMAELHREPIGVLLYDAGHDEQSQYESLAVCHPFIVPQGIIIIDDTNNPVVRAGTERFLAEFSGYEIAFDQRTSCNCHPTFWNGVMVVRKCSSN